MAEPSGEHGAPRAGRGGEGHHRLGGELREHRMLGAELLARAAGLGDPLGMEPRTGGPVEMGDAAAEPPQHGLERCGQAGRRVRRGAGCRDLPKTGFLARHGFRLLPHWTALWPDTGPSRGRRIWPIRRTDVNARLRRLRTQPAGITDIRDSAYAIVVRPLPIDVNTWEDDSSDPRVGPFPRPSGRGDSQRDGSCVGPALFPGGRAGRPLLTARAGRTRSGSARRACGRRSPCACARSPARCPGAARSRPDRRRRAPAP